MTHDSATRVASRHASQPGQVGAPIVGPTAGSEQIEVDSTWFDQVQQGLADREYHASQSASGLQAPNRRQNLRTFFEPSGIRLHDRTSAGSAPLLGLSLVGLGRGERLEAVGAGEVSSSGDRVEIERPDLVEWYSNSPSGLEQGFSLARRPGGSAGELKLELAVAHARAALRGDQVVLATPSGRRLAYDKLVVVDSNGATVPSRIEVPDSGRVHLVVADAGAHYPLTIDPLIHEVADAQIESNQADAYLGRSLAGAGDVNGDGYADAIIGAADFDAGDVDEGAAFIFLGSAAGIMATQVSGAATQLESNQANARFGTSVSAAGDVNGDGYGDVIVGASLYDAGQLDEGAAFVFHGGPAGIADADPTTANARLESDQSVSIFGESVADAGDVDADGYSDVIVGAPRYSDVAAGGNLEGAAFVFRGGPGGIAPGNPTSAATHLKSDQIGSQFGISVAGAGDVDGDGHADVMVGAPEYDGGSGAAFVFLGSAAGIPDGDNGTAATNIDGSGVSDKLGNSVSGAGDVNGDGYGDVIVGAPGFLQFVFLGIPTSGVACVFMGGPSGIPNGTMDSAFPFCSGTNQIGAAAGTSVAGAGDVNGDGYADVIVGFPFYDAGAVDSGAAFVVLGGATAFLEGFELGFAQAYGEFGISVAGVGDVNGDGYDDVIAGAPQLSLGHQNEGAAFVYLGGASSLAKHGAPAETTVSTRLESDQAEARMGTSIAGAGDVNGDGYSDVIVGAQFYDAGEFNEGAAFLFMGSAAGLVGTNPATAAAQIESNQGGAQLGGSSSGAGDVNGDGYGDVIVGAHNYNAGETAEGAAFVFLGSATGISDGSPATAAARLEANQEVALFGWSVSSAGDVDGDGHADVIVGAVGYDTDQVPDGGAAFVFRGSVSGIADGSPATAATRLEAAQTGMLMGDSVSSAGDVNGDGYADVIVGAPAFSGGEPNEGAAFVFLGSETGIASGDSSTSATRLESNQLGAELGQSVSGAGDVNGDGYADVIVGGPLYDAGQSNEGAAFVFAGSAAGIANGDPTSAMARLESNLASSSMGRSVAGVGDVDGDGYGDVIVGANGYSAGQSSEGAAFVFLGSAAGLANGDPTTAGAVLESNQTAALAGLAVAGAGDINGDGYADVIVGVNGYDDPESNEGAAFVYMGNGNGASRPVLARQLRGDASGTAVQPWGGALAGDQFEVRMRAMHPQGRGRAKLEVEVCESGVAFGDVACAIQTSLSWIDVPSTSSGVELAETISGLAPDTLYRWRARILHAPYSVGQNGSTAPLNPAHGPWRRSSAQSVEADIRTVPEPGFTLPVVGGMGFLAWARSRRKRSH